MKKGHENKHWGPNENQLTALAYARHRNFIYKIVDLAAMLNVSTQAIYAWSDCPGYLRWWAGERDRFFRGKLDRVHGAIYERATGKGPGNFHDSELFLKRHDKGYVPLSRREVSGPDGGPVKEYVEITVAEMIGADIPDGEGEILLAPKDDADGG